MPARCAWTGQAYNGLHCRTSRCDIFGGSLGRGRSSAVLLNNIIHSFTCLTYRYSDPRFRRTAALFWGKQWGLDHFQRQMKDSRKIEDIILPFVTTATKALKDDNQLAEGAWKVELNSQISLFLALIGDALHASGGGGELLVRLESYRQRMKDDAPAPAPAPPPPVQASNPALAGVSGNGDDADSASTRTVNSAKTTSASIKGKGTDHVWRLFGMPEEQLVGRLKEMAGTCTEAAALEDLKVSAPQAMVHHSA